MYEKTFSPSFMIPVEDGSGREITLLALLSECRYLKDFTKEQIDNIKTIEVEWDYDGDDIEVYGFGIDGKNIREYNDLPENRSWSERDDILVGSLLMWAELGVD